jgi:hypothetical protein
VTLALTLDSRSEAPDYRGFGSPAPESGQWASPPARKSGAKLPFVLHGGEADVGEPELGQIFIRGLLGDLGGPRSRAAEPVDASMTHKGTSPTPELGVRTLALLS